ncbi:hypothetical protein GCM10009113_34530 [Marinobacter szutsaonensis]
MDSDEVPDEELHPDQADTIGGQTLPASGGCGIRQIEHDPGAGNGNCAGVYLRNLNIRKTLVDEPFIIFCTGNGNGIIIPEPRHRLASIHDGRNT